MGDDYDEPAALRRARRYRRHFRDDRCRAGHAPSIAGGGAYPLPPREIIEGGLPAVTKRSLEEHGWQTATLAAHFGYGAATGALFALVAPRSGVLPGAAYGVLVWTVSYFGIMPGLRILRPAHEHPFRRNALMIAAHLVWGSTMALTLRELERAEQEVLAGDMAPDRIPSSPADVPTASVRR